MLASLFYHPQTNFNDIRDSQVLIMIMIINTKCYKCLPPLSCVENYRELLTPWHRQTTLGLVLSRVLAVNQWTPPTLLTTSNAHQAVTNEAVTGSEEINGNLKQETNIRIMNECWLCHFLYSLEEIQIITAFSYTMMIPSYVFTLYWWLNYGDLDISGLGNMLIC